MTGLACWCVLISSPLVITTRDVTGVTSQGANSYRLVTYTDISIIDSAVAVVIHIGSSNRQTYTRWPALLMWS